MSIIRDYENKTGNSIISPENQKILDKFVDREVINNVSMLITHFMSNETALNGSHYDYDEILNLRRNPNYEESLTDTGWEPFYADYGVLCWHNEQDGQTWAGDAEEVCREFAIEPVENEALEHWIVSSFLRDRLEEKGEITGEVFNMNIWGRTTSGQAVALDHVIVEIACEIGILKGQKYEW